MQQADMQASIVVRLIVVCRIEYALYHIGVCIVVRLIVVCRIEYVLVWHDMHRRVGRATNCSHTG